MSNTNQLVTDYLKAQGITYTVSGGFETKRDDWTCDRWQVVFSRTGKPSIITEYYTGTGHRVLTKMGEVELRRAGKASAGHREMIKRANSKAVAPDAASVLHSLLLDSDSAEQNFHDWCDDFGYDKDSIKKAQTYNACCETLTKMRALFTGTERAALSELLADY